MDSNKYSTQIQKDSQDAQQVGVNSTPTIFVDSEKILGALPYAQLASTIDTHLKGK
jgi:protein-disulfide isomerase